jgi:nitroreductase
MDVFEAIRDRRSIRSFTNKPVQDNTINELINLAQWAPSAGNRQARDFIIIRDDKTKEKLCIVALDQEFIEEAPVVIVVCANEERSSLRYGERGRTLYCILDAAAAVQNLLLAAHSLGLGACWIGAFSDSKVRAILNLPRHMRPIAIIPIGYSFEKLHPPTRLSHNIVVHHELY